MSFSDRMTIERIFTLLKKRWRNLLYHLTIVRLMRVKELLKCKIDKNSFISPGYTHESYARIENNVLLLRTLSPESEKRKCKKERKRKYILPSGGYPVFGRIKSEGHGSKIWYYSLPQILAFSRKKFHWWVLYVMIRTQYIVATHISANIQSNGSCWNYSAVIWK